MTTVRDLLEEPSLALRLVAGDRGLDNEVSAAHVSELLEPGHWMHGGEVLMTLGLLLDGDLRQAQGYVAHCTAAGMAALVVGLGPDLPHQAAPPPLVEAAREHGLPLLELPAPVPFIAVTKWVFAKLAEAEREELRRLAAASRALTAAAVAPDPVPAVLGTWFAETGVACAVLDAGGTVIASAGSVPPDVLAQGTVVAERMSREGVVSAVWPRAGAGRGLDAHPLGTRRSRGVLVVERSGGGAPLLVSVVVSLLSLHLDHQFVAGRPERAHRSHTVAQLLRSGIAAEAALALAARVGLDGSACRVVVVQPHRTDDLEDLSARLSAALPGAVVRPRAAGVELVIPQYVEDTTAILQRAVDGRPTGVGPLAPVDQLAGSARRAHALVDMSRALGRPVESDQTTSTALLRDFGRPEVMAAYSGVVLGPLDQLPDLERAELLETLEQWLQVNGAWEAAAERLNVHRNTVRNRISKIAALTGRQLDQGEERYSLWLALRSRAAAIDGGRPTARATAPGS